MQIPLIRSQLDSNAAFSFSCNRCLRCCRDKRIQINPYESARLARNLGITTTVFLDRYTIHHGAVLKFQKNGQCCFLGPDGCLVHSDRPLVCRLYPLSRHVTDKNEEWFSELHRHEDCAGLCRGAGRIEGYLKDQGASPYMDAADLFFEVFIKMQAVIAKAQQDEKDEPEFVLNTPPESSLPSDMNWMDMDAVVSSYCEENQLVFPDDIENKMQLHIDALRSLVNQLQ